jgi:hypothetical protein
MVQKDGWWYEDVPIKGSDRGFDVAFWQAQGPEAIFRAAWELVETAHKLKGGDPAELRLQRSFVVVEPIRR